jgi:hypothetical protein
MEQTKARPEAPVATAEPQTRPAPQPVPQKPREPLYTISINNQQSGPFSLEQLKNMISSGRVSRDYWILPEGGTDLIPITALPELGSLFEQVQQPAPAVGPTPGESKDAPSEYILPLGWRIFWIVLLWVQFIFVCFVHPFLISSPKSGFWFFVRTIISIMLLALFPDRIRAKKKKQGDSNKE